MILEIKSGVRIFSYLCIYRCFLGPIIRTQNKIRTLYWGPNLELCVIYYQKSQDACNITELLFEEQIIVAYSALGGNFKPEYLCQ